jgi:hypothetical protein
MGSPDRTPEDIASGVLRIAIGGSVKPVPTLPLKHIPAWAALLDELTPDAPAGEPSPDAPADDNHGYELLAKATAATLLTIVTAYDRTGALGGREWLEENADLSQLKIAAEQMASNAFPLGEGDMMVARLLWAQISRVAVPSGPPSSTSGASPTGTGAPTRSARRSTRSS